MRGQILQPHPQLREYIRHYVYCTIGSPDKWSKSSMAPPGCAKLVIVLQEDQVWAKEGDRPASNFSSITYVGQVTRFIPYSWYGKLNVFFVIFHPWGSFPFIGIPQKEFKNLPLNFSDVVASSAKRLQNRIADHDQPEELKEILDQFYLQQILANTKRQERIKSQSIRLRNTVNKMYFYQSAGLSIKEICRQTGYSLSTLERRMKKIVGVTPKQLQRIIRFNRAMQFINHQSSQPNWAQVAQQFGYYDQTHFIKEFKHFNGLTPSEYLTDKPHFLSDV